MSSLSGKSAIVTGAASGIGKAIALAYLKEGANVVAADINETRLKEFEAEVAGMGYANQFAWSKCNVTSDEDCEDAIKLCVEKFGICNVLSHNAGVLCDFSPVAEIKDDVWEKVINVNMTGLMKICRASLRYFLANDVKATMVVVTSDAAKQQVTGGPAYSASKCGAHALLRAIAFEYACKGIRINEIGPGSTASNLGESSPPSTWDPVGSEMHFTRGYNAHKAEWVYQATFDPKEVADVAVFLASDASSSLCGELLCTNGGLCLG